MGLRRIKTQKTNGRIKRIPIGFEQKHPWYQYRTIRKKRTYEIKRKKRRQRTYHQYCRKRKNARILRKWIKKESLIRDHQLHEKPSC